MARNYSQAKINKNPFSKKNPNSKKNRFLALGTFVIFLIIAIFCALTYFFNLSSKDPTIKIIDVIKVKKEKEVVKKRVIKPLSDDDFKGAKEYNFYTQLEERALIMNDEGSVQPKKTNDAPQIFLESSSHLTSVTKKNEDIVPLILESASQRVVNKPKNISKNVAIQVGSFSARSDADNFQNKLKKYNFIAHVYPGKNQANQEIFRVRIESRDDRELESIKKKLNSLNINYFEVK